MMKGLGRSSVKGSSQHSFAQVPKAEIQRSSFKRNMNYKTTFDAGYLVPFYVDEVLPGDTFSLNSTMLARLATPLKPIMDNMYLDVQFFFVPNRLLWTNWERMQGAQDDPGDSIDFLVPQVVAPVGGWSVGSIEDYFGLPTGVAGLSVSALWHRAYNLIFNEWYRDQNLQDSLVVQKDDGPDTAANYTLQRRGKRHDYFTSALPWTQKGDSVTVPWSESELPVNLTSTWGIRVPYWHGPSTTGYEAIGFKTYTGTYPATMFNMARDSDQNTGYRMEPDGSLSVNLSAATSVSINTFREAVQLQRILERDARGGTRYPEILKAHFGVVSPDFRLQRPEYLGGGTMNINVSAIPQTSADSGSQNLGDLGAYGIASGRMGFSKSFVEHGILMGFLSVRADLTYQQGLPRMFSRRTRYDFAMPATAHLGEQAILNKEIYADGSAADNDVFGYQERFAEYRYGLSKVTGQFRSTYSTPLDSWHLAQEFASLPVLNDEFIVENPPVARCIAVQSAPHFLLDAYIECTTARPLPLFGVPGLMDHF
nr:MAG: major capsid protein [Microvirus sp.]